MTAKNKSKLDDMTKPDYEFRIMVMNVEAFSTKKEMILPNYF